MARSKSMNTAEGMAHEYMVSWFRGCSFSASAEQKKLLARVFECAYIDGHKNYGMGYSGKFVEFQPVECSHQMARSYRIPFVGISGKLTKQECAALDGFIQACYKQGQTRAYIERLEALCGKGVDQ